MKKNAKVYIAGHNGLVGSALVRKLQKLRFENLILKTRAELDLMDTVAVRSFFQVERPEYVFLAAARVGGILANQTYPAEFIFQNLTIQNNIIDSAFRYKATKLLFLGSSCIYPKRCLQPIKEEYLMSGKLEETNEAYALAKIAGVMLCQSYNRQYGTNFISIMPTNLYGPNDNFDLQTAHVFPAFIRKFDEAKRSGAEQVTLWGTGTPRREFLHVDDLAEATVFLMDRYHESIPINVGTGEDVSIKSLATLVAKEIGYKGKIAWDHSKPDGTPRKLLNVDKLTALGWKHKISLAEGIKKTYRWYTEHLQPPTR